MSSPLLFALSAPAGTGKSTLANMLCHRLERIERSISCTTRPPRPSEREGIDYIFLTFQEFEKRNDAGLFLEKSQSFGHWYATPKTSLSKSKHTLLVIDSNGFTALRRERNVIGIFLLPPSLKILSERLAARGTEPSTAARLARAREECQHGIEYDYAFVNESLELSFKILESIVIAEEHRSALCPSLAIPLPA